MSEPQTQFVVLHHQLSDNEHWDLMLETGATLATWQILDDPRKLLSAGGISSLRARSIGDHRGAYLDYEGPVSQNRGNVTRVDRGTYALIDRRDGVWVFQLFGDVFKGTYRLTAGPDDCWLFARLPE